MSTKAILSTLPYKLKADHEYSLWLNYTARCARIITENTAGAKGKYISVEYEDIINPKPIKNISAHEVIDNIKNKIDNMNKFTK